MSNAPSPSRFAAVIVAAGQGLRAGQPLPKQFAPWRGKPVIRHSAEALASAGAAPIVAVIPEGAEAISRKVLHGVPGVVLVAGGATRQQSVCNGLAALEREACTQVLIHDAARPVLPRDVIGRLLDALTVHQAAIPVLPVVDSMIGEADAMMVASIERERLRRVQTPQAFRYPAILDAHRAWQGESSASDDAQVAQAAGMAVALVEGDEALHKLTYATDFETPAATARVGFGYDVHRLVDGEELWLCGVRIDHDRGLAGHSDADVAIHALVDAILGAAAAGDIGEHFPPSDPQWRGVSSELFLSRAIEIASEAGYALGNADLTIVCETPKIGPHRQAMRERLATILGVDIDAVSVKATTTEGLGPMGRGEGIAAQAVVNLIPN